MRPGQRWTLAVVCGAVFMLLLGITSSWAPASPSCNGSSTLAPASLVLGAGSLSDRFGRHRIFAIGLVIFASGSLAWGAAVVLGPLVGGVLTTALSWRWVFLVNVPLAPIAVAVALLRVAESRDREGRRPDWLGTAVRSVALFGLVLGLLEVD